MKEEENDALLISTCMLRMEKSIDEYYLLNKR
jgi:hypothetical protein